MKDCVNVRCFVLCYADELKAANLKLIVKVTLYRPVCLLACYTLYQRQSMDISTGEIIRNDHVGLPIL